MRKSLIAAAGRGASEFEYVLNSLPLCLKFRDQLMSAKTRVASSIRFLTFGASDVPVWVA